MDNSVLNIHYDVSPKHFGAHLLGVKLSLEINANIDNTRFLLKIPRWIPGSYKIRDYARFIQIADKSNSIYSIKKLNSFSWQLDINPNYMVSNAAKDSCLIEIDYTVYAFDSSIRGAYLDSEYMFFNSCAALFDIAGYDNLPRTLAVHSPRSITLATNNIEKWNIYCALEQLDTDEENSEFCNIYQANSYAELIDNPVIVAKHSQLIDFNVQNIPHQMLLVKQFSDDIDSKVLADDLSKICDAQMQLFGGSPLRNYLFIVIVSANSYGGIEHENCTVLAASNDMLPHLTNDETLTNRARYVEFLGLCSHEYFHLYNVKRLRPKQFLTYNLYEESHTDMLWFFEGFTAYYDNLMLLKAKVISKTEYLALLEKTFNKVMNTSGRKLTSLGDSSFDAWTMLYMPDENTNNVTISYYSKGALWALYLDYWLQKNTDATISLDNVMRTLWNSLVDKSEHDNHDVAPADSIANSASNSNTLGIGKTEVRRAVKKHIHHSLYDNIDALFAKAVNSVEDLDFAELFKDTDIKYTQKPKTSSKINSKEGLPYTSDVGFKVKSVITNDASKLIVSYVDSHIMPEDCIISVGDEIVAINQQQLNLAEFEELVYCNQIGKRMDVTLLRNTMLLTTTIKLVANSWLEITLTE